MYLRGALEQAANKTKPISNESGRFDAVFQAMIRDSEQAGYLSLQRLIEQSEQPVIDTTHVEQSAIDAASRHEDYRMFNILITAEFIDIDNGIRQKLEADLANALTASQTLAKYAFSDANT